MPDPEEYVEAVLGLVEQVPPGRVTTYGAIAEHLVVERLGPSVPPGAGPLRRGPRTVGRVLAQHGGGVPWWRVVRADGSLPPSHGARAREAYLQEGTALTASGRVDLRRAFWGPDDEPGPSPAS